MDPARRRGPGTEAARANLSLPLDEIIRRNGKRQQQPSSTSSNPPSSHARGNKRPREATGGNSSGSAGRCNDIIITVNTPPVRYAKVSGGGGRAWTYMSDEESSLARLLAPKVMHHSGKGQKARVCFQHLSVRGCARGEACTHAHPAGRFDFSRVPDVVKMALTCIGGYPNGSKVLSEQEKKEEVQRLRSRMRGRMPVYHAEEEEEEEGAGQEQQREYDSGEGLQIVIRNDKYRPGAGLDASPMLEVGVGRQETWPVMEHDEEEEEEVELQALELEQEADEKQPDDMAMADPTDHPIEDKGMRSSPAPLSREEYQAAQRSLCMVPKEAMLCWAYISQQGCAEGNRCFLYHVPEHDWRGSLSQLAKRALSPLGGVNPKWRRDLPAISWVPASATIPTSSNGSSKSDDHDRGRSRSSPTPSVRSSADARRKEEEEVEDRKPSAAAPPPPREEARRRSRSRSRGGGRRDDHPDERARSRSPPGRHDKSRSGRQGSRSSSPLDRHSQQHPVGRRGDNHHDRSRSPPSPRHEVAMRPRSRSPVSVRQGGGGGGPRPAGIRGRELRRSRSRSSSRRARSRSNDDHHHKATSKGRSRSREGQRESQSKAETKAVVASGSYTAASTHGTARMQQGQSVAKGAPTTPPPPPLPLLEDVIRDRERLTLLLKARDVEIDELRRNEKVLRAQETSRAAFEAAYKAGANMLQNSLKEKNEEVSRLLQQMKELEDRVRMLEAEAEEEARISAHWELTKDRLEDKERKDRVRMRELEALLKEESRKSENLMSSLALVEKELQQEKEEASEWRGEVTSKLQEEKEAAVSKERREWSRGVDKHMIRLREEADKVGSLRGLLDGVIEDLQGRDGGGAGGGSARGREGERGISRHPDRDSDKKPDWCGSAAKGSSSSSSSMSAQPPASNGGSRMERCLRDLTDEVSRVARYRTELERRVRRVQGLAKEPRRMTGEGVVKDEGVALQPLMPMDDCQEVDDVEHWQAQHLAWRGTVEMIKKPFDKKNGTVISLDNVERENVVDGLMAKFRQTTGVKMFYKVRVPSLGDEWAMDVGGIARETFTLFWEQLPDKLERTYTVNGEEKVFTLFELTGGGKVFLPRRLGGALSDADIDAIMKSSEIESAYKLIGKIIAKCIIDEIPVPSSWASDLLLCWLGGEKPEEDRVKIGLVEHMLSVVDPEFSWATPARLLASGALSRTVGDVLGNGDESPLMPANVAKVFREFFVQRIVTERRWALDAIKSGFDNVNALVHLHLPAFPRGASRRLLVVGHEEFLSQQVLDLITWDGWPLDQRDHRDAFIRAIEQMTPGQLHDFFRMVTSLNAIPSTKCKISVYPKYTTEPHPTFATCSRCVYLPCTHPPEQLAERLYEAISQENRGFQELA